jgi:hypothetical protein
MRQTRSFISSFEWAGGEFRVLRTLIPRLLTPEVSAQIKVLSRSEHAKARRRAEQAAKLHPLP